MAFIDHHWFLPMRIILSFLILNFPRSSFFSGNLWLPLGVIRAPVSADTRNSTWNWDKGNKTNRREIDDYARICPQIRTQKGSVRERGVVSFTMIIANNYVLWNSITSMNWNQVGGPSLPIQIWDTIVKGWELQLCIRCIPGIPGIPGTPRIPWIPQNPLNPPGISRIPESPWILRDQWPAVNSGRQKTSVLLL